MPSEDVKPLNVLLREREAPVNQRQAVLVRMDDALHRIDQLALALEKAADEIERKLGIVKGKM